MLVMWRFSSALVELRLQGFVCSPSSYSPCHHVVRDGTKRGALCDTMWYLVAPSFLITQRTNWMSMHQDEVK